MNSRRAILLTDSSTDQSLGSAGSHLSKSSLLSIPQPRKLRSKSADRDRSKHFLSLHARYVEDSSVDKPKILTEANKSPRTKKKPRRIKRTNAFYLNKSNNGMTDDDLDTHRRSCTSATSDESSRLSVSNVSVSERWASQSGPDTDGSLESLDLRSRRRTKISSTLAMGQKDVLINLKKKMQKKNPRYQGSIDVIQRTILRIMGSSFDIATDASNRLLLSKAAHHSFDCKRKQYLFCGDCNGTIIEGDLVVCSNESSPKLVWHPNCFKCSECDCALVDLVYHIYEGRKYCTLHKPILPKICSYCMEEITQSEEYSKANGRFYHPEHFQCWQCATVLSGERYYGCGFYPMCVACYDSQLAKPCRSCKGAIQIDTQFYSVGRRRWHASPFCFKCSACQASLVGSRLISSRGELFCNRQCFAFVVNNRTSFSG